METLFKFVLFVWLGTVEILAIIDILKHSKKHMMEVSKIPTKLFSSLAKD